MPINKYIRNSFNLIKNENIIQTYFFEKEKINNNNKFILEFSSNYENIELEFDNKITNSTPIIIGGFKKYALSIDSNNSNDFYFNIIIKPINQTNSEKCLKEVNIFIKYYNEEKEIKTDYICKKTFRFDVIKNNTENYSDYKLIINNKYEINDINYTYYLRLIKKDNALDNEELNTTALISSNLSYINKFNSSETKFYLNNLEYNETYIALFFIKVKI